LKILFFGDIYGRVGRNSFLRELPSLREKYAPDLVIVNIDNLTSGRGPVLPHIELLKKTGVDVFTGGDHVFDNKDSISEYLDSDDSRLLRPANF
jgi:calcineurin-like phosphoesterase